ncbi:type VI secretion lipoprotein [Marinomonas sp. S3726]|uniref:type VI secretion system baseplate subunit TssF n=1 Tax=Marinomonas sp. S3726 TaxID=579484 RepID=UPI0005FA3130|nr:type VI secretion system baseplate subunit TssF [Marinomonas sp. S3726]KJZ14719.1 type VI secretion lipoprotein [Marinomonas sp. S3726]
MSDQLMRYYERELAYVRKSLDEFVNQFPEQAGTLRLNQSANEDPNISRLIDAMALLTAKTEKRIDEQFPELVQGLFSLLYPGYLQVSPSYTVLELEADPDKLSDIVFLPNGSPLTLPVKSGHECEFTTVSDLQILPLEITQVKAQAAPFNFITPSQLKHSDSVIQIELSALENMFSQIAFNDFNFYIRGFENNSASVIDLLLLQTEVISVFHGDQQKVIEVDRLVSRIADEDFQWLPKYASHFKGYDLLRDYFTYPDKSAFFSIKSLGRELSEFSTDKVTINFFVKQLPAEFLRLFDKSVFALNAVPSINLFETRGEPLNYDFSKLALPVVADVNAGEQLEIVSVESVSEVLPTGEIALSPVYESGYWHDDKSPQWQAKQYWNEQGKRHIDLSISYPYSQPSDSIVLSMMLKVCNGRTPCLVPAGTEADSLAAIDLPGVLKTLSAPTAPHYPDLDNRMNWRFIALLNSNFSSLLQADDPVKALQHALRLCCPQTLCPQADAIKNVEYQHLVSPMTIMQQTIFASGTEVTITLDDELIANQVAVFAHVLNHFYQQFCSFDRFIQLKIKRFGNSQSSIDFPKVHGSQVCL